MTVTEGNSATTNATFSVTLSGLSDQTVTAGFATADGTASAGSDYTAVTNGTVTIPAGSTSGTATVRVKGDALDEAKETFLMKLRNPSNATHSDATGVGRIIDDDTAPTVTRVNPAENATGVSPNTNVSAIFSEAMNKDTLTTRTFKLLKPGVLASRSLAFSQGGRRGLVHLPDEPR